MSIRGEIGYRGGGRTIVEKGDQVIDGGGIQLRDGDCQTLLVGHASAVQVASNGAAGVRVHRGAVAEGSPEAVVKGTNDRRGLGGMGRNQKSACQQEAAGQPISDSGHIVPDDWGLIEF